MSRQPSPCQAATQAALSHISRIRLPDKTGLSLFYHQHLLDVDGLLVIGLTQSETDNIPLAIYKNYGSKFLGGGVCVQSDFVDSELR